VDGDTLVAAINQTIESGEWGDAKHIWTYIKSRRIKLITEMTEADKEVLDGFIKKLRKKGVYILRRGDLENYLPTGNRPKDTEKLIELVNMEDFWGRLPIESRVEIEIIVDAILTNTILES
jgi:putative ATP-dependent endonuclease of OLD family